MMLKRFYSNPRLIEMLWVILAQVLGMLGGLVGLKILTNFLSGEQFGIFQLGLSAALILSTALFNPLGFGIMRLHPMHMDKGEGRQFFEWNVGVLSKLTMLFLAVGLVFSLLFAQLTEFGFLLGFGTLLLIIGLGIAQVLQHYQTALRQRITFTISQLGVSLGRPLGAVLAVFIFYNAPNQAAYALAGSGVFLILFWVVQLYFIRLGFSKTQIADKTPKTGIDTDQDTHEIPTLYAVTRPMAIVGFLSVFSMYADRWLMGTTLSLVDIGIYAAIYQIAIAPLTFAHGVAVRFSLPIIFEQMGSNTTPEQRAAARKSAMAFIGIWGGMIGTIVLVSFVADRFIVRLLTTETIAQYASLLPILVVGIALERTAQVMTVKGNMEFQFGRYLPARLVHIALMFSVGLWLLPTQGIYAFGWAYIVAGVAIVIATWFANKKVV